MEKNKGVTLLSLVITIIVLMILASISMISGKETIRSSKFTKFQAELEIMQRQVEILNQKYKNALTDEEKEQIEQIGKSINEADAEVLETTFSDMGITDDAEKEQYRYYDNETIASLDISGIEQEYLVDVINIKVIVLGGFKYEETIYYTLDQTKEKSVQTGGFNRDGQTITIENASCQRSGSRYIINLNNVQCSKYVGKYDVKYKKANDDTYKLAGESITSNDFSFKVEGCGVYYIKVEDAAGIRTERKRNIVDASGNTIEEAPDIIISAYNDMTFDKETTITMVKSITDTSTELAELVVPANFTISGDSKECAQTILGTVNEVQGTIDDGVVIYLLNDNRVKWNDEAASLIAKQTYDQFVWVPVPNPVAASDAELTTMMNEGKYPIAVAIEGTDDNGLQNYRGALYNFALSEDGTKVDITAKAWSTDSTSYREPAYLTNSSYADASSYNNVGITEELLQQEYNKMVDRVKTNKGFWVGRYETSNMDSSNLNDTTQQINVVKGTTTGITSVNWYRMYAQQKNYSKLVLGSATTTTSSMIWGSQWDQIMIWMKGIKNTSQNSFYVVNSVGMGNYGTISGVDDGYSDTSNPAATGCFEVKNVYDLAGNLLDWSLEALNSNMRVFRGGYYDDTDSSYARADDRGNNSPYVTYNLPGSRATLY